MAETKKKFCPDCGKPIVSGKKHVCGEGSSINADDILNTCKGYLDDVINMFKKPTTTLKDKYKNASVKDGIVILVLVALVAGLFVLLAIKPILIMTIKSTMGLTITDFSGVKIPYFKIFIITMLSSLVFAMVPVLVTFVTGKIMKKDELTLSKSLVLYAYAIAPTICVDLVLTIVFLTKVNILVTIGVLLAAAVSLVCLINYFGVVNSVLGFKEDIKPYGIVAMVAAWLAIVYIILAVCGSTLYGDMTPTLNTSKNTSSSSALFKF